MEIQLSYTAGSWSVTQVLVAKPTVFNPGPPDASRSNVAVPSVAAGNHRKWSYIANRIHIEDLIGISDRRCIDIDRAFVT